MKLRKGSIKLEIEANGNYRLSNMPQSIVIERADIDDAIEVLIEARLSQPIRIPELATAKKN